MIYYLGTKGRMREEEKERGRKKEIKVERERMRERETERGGERETEKTCQKLGKHLILYKARPDILKIPATINN